MLKVDIKGQWDKDIESGMEAGMMAMMVDVDYRSSVLAPKDTSALVNSRRLKKTAPGEITLSYGSSKVPYARQRHFTNRKNPGTVGYLAKAGDSVSRSDKSKYFKGKV